MVRFEKCTSLDFFFSLKSETCVLKVGPKSYSAVLLTLLLEHLPHSLYFRCATVSWQLGTVFFIKSEKNLLVRPQRFLLNFHFLDDGRMYPSVCHYFHLIFSFWFPAYHCDHHRHFLQTHPLPILFPSYKKRKKVIKGAPAHKHNIPHTHGRSKNTSRLFFWKNLTFLRTLFQKMEEQRKDNRIKVNSHMSSTKVKKVLSGLASSSPFEGSRRNTLCAQDTRLDILFLLGILLQHNKTEKERKGLEPERTGVVLLRCTKNGED